MAVIRKVDMRSFSIDGDVKFKSYRAFARDEYVSLLSDSPTTPRLFAELHFSRIQTQEDDGTVIVNGATPGTTVAEVVQSLNEIVNFRPGGLLTIPDNLQFDTIADRDAYFNPTRLSELLTGIEILVRDDGSGGELSYSGTSTLISAQNNSPSSMAIDAGNAICWIADDVNDTIERFVIASDDTLTFDTYTFDASSQDTQLRGLAVHEGLDKLYLVGGTADTIYRYSIDTDNELSYDNYSFSIGSQDSAPTGLAIDEANGKLWMVGSTGDTIERYSIDSSGDLTYDSYSVSIRAQDGGAGALTYDPTRNKLWMNGVFNEVAYRYSVSDTFEVTYDEISLATGTEDGSIRGMSYDAGTDQIFMVGDSTDTVYVYSFSVGDEVIQRWFGESDPENYDATHWHTIGIETLTGQEARILIGIEGVTNGYLPIRDNSGFANSALRETDTRIISSKSIEVPPGTIYIGENAALSNALRALNVTDPVLDRRALLLAQLYDDTGESPAFIYDISAIQTVSLNQLDTQTADETNFTYTVLNNELLRSMSVYSTRVSDNVPFVVLFRINSHEGPEIYRMVGDVTTDTNGMGTIEFSNPILSDAGTTFYIRMECDSMVGSMISGEFVPRSSVDVHVITRNNIASEDYVDAAVATMITDDDAIHDNVAGEIAAITQKTTPVNADHLLIEDSADSNSKKRVTVGSLPPTTVNLQAVHVGQNVTITNNRGTNALLTAAGGSTGGILSSTDWTRFNAIANNGIRRGTANEISIVTLKPTLVDDDVILIEDSEDGNSKKRTTVNRILGRDLLADLNLLDTNPVFIDVSFPLRVVNDYDMLVGTHTVTFNGLHRSAVNSVEIEASGRTLSTSSLAFGILISTINITITQADADAWSGASTDPIVFTARLRDVDNNTLTIQHFTEVQVTSAMAGIDSDAIHDNVAGEIDAITEKTSPVSADIFLIEDSEDSNNKKKVQIGNITAGGMDSDAIHDNVAGEIAAITSKAAPVDGDILLIEDSEDSNNKKSTTVANIKTATINDVIDDDVVGFNTTWSSRQLNREKQVNIMNNNLVPTDNINFFHRQIWQAAVNRTVTLNTGASVPYAWHMYVEAFAGATVTVTGTATINGETTIRPNEFALIIYESTDQFRIIKYSEDNINDNIIDVHSTWSSRQINRANEHVAFSGNITPSGNRAFFHRKIYEAGQARTVTLNTGADFDYIFYMYLYANGGDITISGTATIAGPTTITDGSYALIVQTGGDNYNIILQGASMVTNLGLTRTADDITITSSNGADVTVSSANITQAGSMTSSHVNALNASLRTNAAGQISTLTEKTTPVANDVFIIEDSADSNNKKRVSYDNLEATDPDAIHTNVAAEITTIPVKENPTYNDQIVVEDSEDSFNKKRVSFGKAHDGDAIHDNVDGEFAQIVEKTTPIGNDTLLIEDSEASNGKRRIKISNLGGTDATAFHNNVNHEISLLTGKTTTNTNDIFVIEDADDDFNKKRLSVGHLLSGVSAFSYTDGAGTNNELVAKTGTNGEAKGSGIILNSDGRIPFNQVGNPDVSVLTGTALTINTSNIDNYKDRTVFINRTVNFNLIMAEVQDFIDDNTGRFFIRVENVGSASVFITVSNSGTVGGSSQVMLTPNESVTFQLPPTGTENNYPVIAEFSTSLMSRVMFDFITQNANYTISQNQNGAVIRHDDSTAYTYTLTEGLTDGTHFYIDNRSSQAITLTRSGTETVEGGTSYVIDDQLLILVVKSGTDWKLLPLEQYRNSLEPRIEVHYMTLFPGRATNPAANTSEIINFLAEWEGSQQVRVDIGGNIIDLGSFTRGQYSERFTITSTQWNTLFTNHNNSSVGVDVFIGSGALVDADYRTAVRLGTS